MTNVYDFLKMQPETYKQFACKDLLIALYDCPQSRQREEVFTQHSYLTYGVSGKKWIHREGQTLLFSEGSLSFVRKGGFVQELFTGEGFKSLTFYIPDAYLKQLVQDFRHFYRGSGSHKQAKGTILTLVVNETTKNFLLTILNLFERETQPSDNLVEERLREFFFALVINPENQGFVNYLNSLTELPRTSLFEVMEANYMYNLSLKEYANIANRSLATFKREFRKVFDTTPTHWLMQKRLVYATTLLNTTDKSIADVLLESGFENSSHFSRVFKDKFGVPPVSYRKQRSAT